MKIEISRKELKTLAGLGMLNVSDAQWEAILDLRSDVDLLQEGISALTTDQGRIDADVLDIDNQLAAFAAAVVATTGHVTNIESEIASLKSQLAGGVAASSIDLTGLDNAAANAHAALAAVSTLAAQVAGDDLPAPAAPDVPPVAPPADVTPPAPVDPLPPVDPPAADGNVTGATDSPPTDSAPTS